MVDTKVKLGDWVLKNPIIPASGTFGYGKEFSELYDLNVLGSISIKGTTLNERYGNPLPRIAECPMGMLNAVGLQNPGIQKVVEEELPWLAERFDDCVIANISGFTVEEYVEVARMLNDVRNVGIVEVNISCPNVHGGGMAFGTDASAAYTITKAVKEVCRKPVYVKLSPNVTNIVEIAKACEKAGADGLCLINTMLGMRIDLRTKKPVIANVKGGYSGPGIYPVALRMVYEVYEAVSIPIIGMGGIERCEDVIEMMLAGASAVQIGASNLVDPFICKKLVEQLPSVMERYGIESLQEIVGKAHI